MGAVANGKRLGGWCLAFLVSLSVPNVVAGGDQLIDAVKQGDAQIVRSLLEQQSDVDAAQPDGATALMWAAHRNDLDTVELLIRAGANVNAANDYGATPLWLACTHGSASLVEMLLKAGADPNATLLAGETALMAAAERSAELVMLLLTHGADEDAKEHQGGQTALMRAAAANRSEVVQTLVEFGGADVSARSKGGFTPLLFAVQQNGQDAAMVLLAAGANVNEVSPETSPLLLASARGYEALAVSLLKMDADPNVVDFRGYSPLHYAASRRNMLGAVEALLARGANPNTPIWREAAKSERISIVAVPFLEGKPSRVIPAGARGGTIPIGATPLWLAAASRNIDAMRLLADAGADPHLATTETVFLAGASGRRINYIGKTTPLMHVAGVGRILGNWHDYNAVEMTFALEALQMLVDLGADVNEVNDYGYTALHGAAYIGADPVVQFLADHGARLDVMDKMGQTPLSVARHVITASLGDNFDSRPRRLFATTSDLLLALGATPLRASGVQVLRELGSSSLDQ